MDWTSGAQRQEPGIGLDWVGLGWELRIGELLVGPFFFFIRGIREYWHFFNGDSNSGPNICYISLAPSVRIASWPEEREQWPRCARVGRHHVATTIASAHPFHHSQVFQLGAPKSHLQARDRLALLHRDRDRGTWLLVPLSASFNAANWGKFFFLSRNWGSDRDGTGKICVPPASESVPIRCVGLCFSLQRSPGSQDHSNALHF